MIGLTAPEPLGMTAADLAEGVGKFETPFSEYLGSRLANGWQSTSFMLAGRFLDREGEQLDQGVGAEMGAPGEAYQASPQDLRATPGLAPSGQRLMPEEEWRASPDYRPDLDYDPRMTETRAKALAEQRDANRYRQWLIGQGDTGTLRTVLGFGAELLGSLPDPMNVIPVGGPAWRTAMAARYGTIGGRALVGAAEGLVGQALIEPFQVADRVTLGEDVKFADVLMDLAMGAAAGGVLGGGLGAIEKLRARGAEPILSVDEQAAVARPLNEAAASIVLGDEVAIRPETLEAVRPVRAELEAARRHLDAEERVAGMTPDERLRTMDALPEAERVRAQGMEVAARTVQDPAVAAKLRADVDRLLARQIAADMMPSQAMDTAAPRRPEADPAIREADAAVGRPELPAETAARAMGEQTLGAEPRQGAGQDAARRPAAEKGAAPPPKDQPEVAALRQAGRLSKEMEAAVKAADEAATRSEAVADALDAAAACLVRAA